MELAVAKRLIQDGVEQTPNLQVWADLGAGKGLFTNALSQLLPAGGAVYAVDRDASALREIAAEPSGRIRIVKKDFVRESLNLEPLDGVLMANALHFVLDKTAFLNQLRKSMKANGRLIIVEYDRETSTPWVPHPLPFKDLEKLAFATGFDYVARMDEEPSLFNRVNMYSALVRQQMTPAHSTLPA